MPKKLALVALGANLSSLVGSPSETLREALKLISRSCYEVLAVSRLWTTPAFPKGSGPDYVNAAAILLTDCSAEETLDFLHEIEFRLGRVRNAERWASRGIDLDLLAVEDLVLPTVEMQKHWRLLSAEAQRSVAPTQLILPHPRIQDRAFVLVPLADVAPQWVHPVLGKSVAQMLGELPAEERAEIKLAESPMILPCA